MTFSNASAMEAVGAHPADEPPAPDGVPSAGAWHERVEAALPLFILGAVCIFVAVVLYFEGAYTSLAGAAHLEPWILFVALGITALGGATVVLLAEDPYDEAPVVAVEAPVLPASAPVWDESLLEPEAKPVRPVYHQLDDAELMEGPVADASPPDIFLRQLDDLEVSLRRKGSDPAKTKDESKRP